MCRERRDCSAPIGRPNLINIPRTCELSLGFETLIVHAQAQNCSHLLFLAGRCLNCQVRAKPFLAS
jgi:hypothetical protein